MIALLPSGAGDIRIWCLLCECIGPLCIGISEERLLEFKEVFQDAGFECWETNIACGGTTLHSVTSSIH